jgi:hypothetical protein
VSDPTLPAPAYDVARVVADARTADPGLPVETAQLLAAEAGEHLAGGAADAPELARRLFADHPESGATAANVVARAACLAAGVAP